MYEETPYVKPLTNTQQTILTIGLFAALAIGIARDAGLLA